MRNKVNYILSKKYYRISTFEQELGKNDILVKGFSFIVDEEEELINNTTARYTLRKRRIQTAIDGMNYDESD